MPEGRSSSRDSRLSSDMGGFCKLRGLEIVDGRCLMWIFKGFSEEVAADLYFVVLHYISAFLIILKTSFSHCSKKFSSKTRHVHDKLLQFNTLLTRSTSLPQIAGQEIYSLKICVSVCQHRLTAARAPAWTGSSVNSVWWISRHHRADIHCISAKSVPGQTAVPTPRVVEVAVIELI